MSSRSAARGTAAASSMRLTLRTSNAVATSNASPSRCFLFCEGSRAARSARTAAATVSTPPISKAPPNQRRSPPITSTFQAARGSDGCQGGRALLEALAAGENNPERLAGLVRTKIRASHAQVGEAVRGRLVAHQRLLLRLYFAQVDALDAAIAAIDHELGERLEPVQETVRRLTTMPGLSPFRPAPGVGL